MKGKKTKQMSVVDSAIWDDLEVILPFIRLPKGQQKKCVFLLSNSSEGREGRSSGPSAGRFPTSLDARDDVEWRPPL